MFRQVVIRRTIVAIAVLVLIAVFATSNQNTPAPTTVETTEREAITLTMGGEQITSFTAATISELDTASFEDAEESKQQTGFLLRDVILLYVNEDDLADETQVIVSSSTREKSVTLSWREVADLDNHVLFEVSANRGTLKLASSGIEKLDTRAEWIQDTDRIDIQQP